MGGNGKLTETSSNLTIQSTSSNDLNLTILDLVEKGLNPAKICKRLNMKKTTLQYYLSSLKEKGLIQKIGYGVWKRSSNSPQQTSSNLPWVANPKPDSVRGHAFVVKFALPSDLRNWDKREDILLKLTIPFEALNSFYGNGQRLIFKGHKVWLTNHSIIIYGKPGESYFAKDSKDSKDMALNYFIGLYRGIESLLKANFGGRIKFKVSRQHYALIKNALAKQYDQEGKKLEVYSDKGLWLLIDNSFNLHETEGVHPVTSPSDTTKVQDFFNGIKQYENFTPQFIVDSLGQSVQANIHLDHNLKTHFEVLGKISQAVQDLTVAVREMKK